MRKFIPFVFCGLAAFSYGAMAADNAADSDKSVRGESNAVTGADAGADVRGDANPGAGTAADNAVSEKKGNEVHGATSDSHQKPGRQAKRKKNRDEAGAGATGSDKY